MVESEYNYFTLRSYLKMNEESKHDLEKLCQMYATSGSNGALSFGAKAKQSVNPLPEQVLSDREKMLRIADFIERSEEWHKNV